MTQNNFIKFILAILLAFSISACSTDVPTVSPTQAAQLFSDQQALLMYANKQNGMNSISTALFSFH